MGAEGPKERPTAVLSDQLSARLLSERYRNRDVELFCSTPRVPWRQ